MAEEGGEEQVFTTNAEDQAAVKILQQRLASGNANNANTNANTNTNTTQRWTPVSPVIIANGQHKYVLISAREPGQGESSCCYFVTSKRGAHYHRNAAEPIVDLLEQSGYTNIDVLGGGRISLDDEKKKIFIFGFSYGFGRADHFISQKVIEADERYKDYDVSWSNDGY